ncbi:thioredoxin family protein [Paenibacillus gansuensis]|uniref:Thioredoxin family protein n=1 Tax=Paenibacillus gansuensis TaxID=306542 RepID=A0ABW5PA39_9BACL
MKELTEKEAAERRFGGNFALFLYTPLCGTCKVAARMLEIIEAMHPEAPFYQTNVNFAPDLVQRFQITSIPCILIFIDGRPVETLYAMKSVDELYTKLKPVIERS